ncbi:spore germination protein [Bacillus taeanensis]|uniref:Spore gernimation protein GerPA n=1 Tax=Bacillus taeanensis TaxID=273032 RepID=A0A366XTK3_9BACI|nr:spore germination protein [Bacillus taeanensis]RBW68996.1 spore gernimation protein GerPA [Bacillus taeanensis]
MPAVVGKVNFISIGEATVTQFGDIFWVAPVSEDIIFGGPGSFNSGDFDRTYSEQNVTLIPNDDDLVDTSNIGVL